MTISLYQFQLSHFCEKARWALDYKNIDYEVINLLPGFHAATTKKLCGRSSVPVIVHNDVATRDSAIIISYLDDAFPENPLTPHDPELRDQAIGWEQYADKEIGPAVRLCFYHLALDHPQLVASLFTQGGPWYGKFLYRIIFPKLREKMRVLMKINEQTYQSSLTTVDNAVDKLVAHINGRTHIVGDTFTRADLAVAALFAPLCQPSKYALEWPKEFPESLKQLFNRYTDRLDWVSRTYEKYR